MPSLSDPGKSKKQSKPSLDDLSKEQREAVVEFAAEHGKGWKDKLVTGWMKAAYPGPLQQVRNQFGPAWLEHVTIPSPSTSSKGRDESLDSAPVAPRDIDPVLPTPGSGVEPDRVNDRGCQVFRDENAGQMLKDWGYPAMGGSRYPFDEHLKGWEQFDTPQDASYYGVWTSVERKAVVSYTEGDVTLVVAPDMQSFQAEVRSLWDWNHAFNPHSGVHTQMDSPKLHDACLVGHPPFDQVLAGYRLRQELEHKFEELHAQVFAKLEDPSLPEGTFHIRSSEDHVYFLRGRKSDYRIICVCQKVGYDLNSPEYTLGPSIGGDAETLNHRIGLMQEFLDQRSD